MYPVTQDFLDKTKADERRIYGRIAIDYTDPFLDQSIEVTTSENASVSFPTQIADAVPEPFAKIASLDGSWVLDGTFALAPGPNEADTHQMGWWGSQLAQADGAFVEPYPALTITHFARPVHNLGVVGDSKRGEYPVDFRVELYAQDDTLLHSEVITGNVGIEWSMVLPSPVLDVVKQVLIITKWSYPGRQVKILEFFTSIREIYEGDDVFLIHLLEEREISQGSLPVGNISANEIDIRLNNSTRKFDAGNIQSPLYQLLKQNRRIRAWLGIEHVDETKEWVPLGVFWSGDWSAPENGVYAQTTGRDRLELLRKSTYSTSQVQQNKTLYDLALAVLQDAGLKAEKYWVDIELQQFAVPYVYFEPISHREALRRIAEACLGQVYCDRNGLVRMEGPSYLAGQIQAVLEITSDDYFPGKDNPVKWSEIANYIEVETAPLRPDILQEVYRSNEPVSISAGETKSLTVFYNQIPCVEAAASLEDMPAECVIQSTTYYAWGANVEIYSPDAGTFVLVINAKPLKILNKERVIVKDDVSITDNGLIKYTFPTNSLVQTQEVAQNIANKLLAAFKDPRRDLEIEWRGNPALLLGDRVKVIDRNEQNDYHVIRQEIEWAGALSARLTGRKAV